MDLTLSPDLDARLCYGIVFLCAVVGASFQVQKRFTAAKLPTAWIWRLPTTWVIFGIHIALPLGLFWFMDRASALSDTSFFAALLVGLAYPAVLGGGFGGLKAPAGMDGVLKPVTDFTASLVEKVNQQLARMENDLGDHLVSRMMAVEQVYAEMLAEARKKSAVAAELDASFPQTEEQLRADVRLREKKARKVYFYLSSTPEDIKTMTDNATWMGDTKKSPMVQARRNMCWAGAILLVVLGLGIWASFHPGLARAYNLWRLGKPNNTAADRHRAGQRLGAYLRDPKHGETTYRAITGAIRVPGLSAERVDLYLQQLLQARTQSYHAALLCSNLVGTLQVENVDARGRIHQALIYLAEQRDRTNVIVVNGASITNEVRFKSQQKDLADWNPAAGDSVPKLEKRVDQWRAYFCPPP